MIATRRPHFLATANVDFLVQSMHDVELRRILSDADLVLCDGMPLVWASHLLGNPLPERVAGSDLVPQLIELAEQREYRVFFLGGEQKVLEKAMENLREKHPKLKIAGAMSPPFNPLLDMDHDGICKTIRDSAADMVFVSFGCPKQEKWIAMNYRKLGAPVCMGVGATIDFLAGTVKRAPRWMQRCGLEWTWRLAQEPRRLFKRYFIGLKAFSGGIAKQIFALRSERGRGVEPLRVSNATKTQVVELPSVLTEKAMRLWCAKWSNIAASGKPTLIDGAHVTVADSTGVALLLRLQKDMRMLELPCVFAALSEALMRALKVNKLEGVLDVCATIELAFKVIEERNGEKPVSDVVVDFVGDSKLNWHGEVTACNATEVWKRTEVLLMETKMRGGAVLGIDLNTLRFLDSSGVGLMVKARKCGAACGVDVRFLHPTEIVTSIIRTLRMEQYIFGTTQNLPAT